LKTLLFILITFLTSCFEKSIEEQLKARDLNNNMVVDEVEEYFSSKYSDNDHVSRVLKNIYLFRSKLYFQILISKNLTTNEALELALKLEGLSDCFYFMAKKHKDKIDKNEHRTENKKLSKLMFSNKKLLKKYLDYNKLLHGQIFTYNMPAEEQCIKSLGDKYE
jgi:hypothetical protein